MKRYLISVFLCCLISYSFCTLGYADEYFVYGGQSFSTTEPNYWEKGYHPELHGYDLLGTGDTSQSSKTFFGSYSYYIITVYPVNIADIDTVEGSNEQYFGTGIMGNTINYQNVGGPPDGNCAAVGGQFEGSSGGFIVIDASSHSLSSITVYACTSTNEPNPDIKANASDGPVTIAPGDILSVSVQLDSGDKEGEYADWWVLAKLPPGGWYHYKLSGWKPDISYVKQGPLHDVPAKQVLNTSTLAEGTYTFYFGVDTIMNGKIDMDALHYDTVEVNITTIPDTCGAFVAPDVWKEFDCYNLAAIGKTTDDDPFTPSWRLIGGYWQWGRKGPTPSLWYDTNTENFAHGPTGPGDTEANEGEISNWDDVFAPDGSWSDSEKTANDPCPNGFRVPTIAEWEGVLDNNNQRIVGTWDSNPTNYSSALFFGDDLMLPAAGNRSRDLSGALALRDNYGFYWSSSEYSDNLALHAWYLFFSSRLAEAYSGLRLNGFSVRCITE